MQETCFSGTSLTLPKSPAKNSGSSQRSSRDLDDPLTENDHDRCSLASFGSGNTTDSDNKVSPMILVILYKYQFLLMSPFFAQKFIFSIDSCINECLFIEQFFKR